MLNRADVSNMDFPFILKILAQVERIQNSLCNIQILCEYPLEWKEEGVAIVTRAFCFKTTFKKKVHRIGEILKETLFQEKSMT